MKVGTYAADVGRHSLSVSLGAAAFASFFPDRAFVVRSGGSPVDGFVLTGPSTFFTRLRHRQVRFVDRRGRARSGSIPPPRPRERPISRRSIAQGRQLFLKETFEGNGRTCGTCHVETNNFTVDPDAHRHSAFERSALRGRDQSRVGDARESGPVAPVRTDPGQRRRIRPLERVRVPRHSERAGARELDDAAGPELLASTSAPTDEIPIRPSASAGATTARRSAISRSWRSRSMRRRRWAASPGVDFRVPTDEELDALVAYQLALGRQEDFDLPALELKSALASHGKTLFLDSGNLFEPGHKNCNGCHFNGGGTAGMSFNPATPGFPRRGRQSTGVQHRQLRRT